MTIPKWNQTETTLSSDRLSMSSAGDTEYYIDVQRDVVRRIRFHQSAAVYITLQQLIEQDYLPRSAYHYEEDGMGGFDVEITDQQALTAALEEYASDQDADDIFYESYEEQAWDDEEIVETTDTEVYEWGVN
jgi:hypothetical protein